MSEAASGSALRLAGLRVDAAGRPICGPLDLRVGAGEHVVVSGPSGSGKTTLLRAIAGLVRPQAGTVELFGVLASDGRRILVPPEERGIGFLFQGGALWPHMSAERTLRFVLRRAGTPRSELPRRVTELLAWVELAGHERRMPATLSGGEAQRLALARALAGGPRLLLLDEPLGPLDRELRGALLARLGELQARLGLTVVHVTHDPDEASVLATRTVHLEGGRIAREASA